MKHLGESLDSFGLPHPVESYDVEVEFDYRGRRAVALFEVEIASQPLPGSREFPAEAGVLDIALVDVWEKESDEDIDPQSLSDAQKEELMDRAADRFWDQIYSEIGKDE